MIHPSPTQLPRCNAHPTFGFQAYAALSSLICMALLSAPGQASAQAAQSPLNLAHFRAPEVAGDPLWLGDPASSANTGLRASVFLDYGSNTLVIDQTIGGEVVNSTAVIEQDLRATLGLAYGFSEALSLFAGLPYVVDQSGLSLGTVAPADGPGLSDAYAGLRYGLPSANEGTQLALQLRVNIPQGNPGASYSTDDGLTYAPGLLFATRLAGSTRFLTNLEYLIRPASTGPAGLQVGSVLGVGAGFEQRLSDAASLKPMHAHLQVYSGMDTADLLAATNTPVEVSAGLDIRATHSLEIQLGGGIGVGAGIGRPDIRGIFAIAYAPSASDRDGDFWDDRVDQCPDEPEDYDGLEDTDGCPEPGSGDRDGDGLNEEEDQCPTEAGPQNNRGCPDADRDGDGLVDRFDNCPDQAGAADNYGCEAPQLVHIEACQIQISEPVFFETAKAAIKRRSFPLLNNMGEVLAAHPEITRLRVEGHTDSTGRPKANMVLSRRRAAAVKRYLERRGVAPERLSAQGFGPTKPRASNKTRAGKAQNRRVEFVIDGCVKE